MGQKTNPLCFRLGTTQSHHSIWFEEPKKYATGIQEDQKIRDFFKNYVQYRLNKYYQMVVKEVNQRNTKYENIRIPPLGFEGIVRIKIEKQANKIQKPFIRIKIYSGFVPKFLLKENTLAHFRENIKKQEFYSVYPSPRKITVHLEKAEIHYRQPNLLAEYIALQLKNRVPYRKTMAQAIDLARKTDTKGIKVKLAGRIDGKDIARKEGKREGKLPLQIICSKIDYGSHTIQTIYGVLGLKIWIFRK